MGNWHNLVVATIAQLWSGMGSTVTAVIGLPSVIDVSNVLHCLGMFLYIVPSATDKHHADNE